MKGGDSGSCRGRAKRLFLSILFSYVALVVFYLAVFRLRSRRLNDAVRVFNKHVLNPVTMFVDRRHFYSAVLRHTGRRSGKEYSIPVVARPVEGGYVIPLAYGDDVDWLKSVRASGGCTIEARDGLYTLGKPRVMGVGEALGAMPPRARLMFKAFGHERCLKLERLPETSAGAA